MERLPARSTLSRFLAALTPEAVEALRSLFLEDLLARPLCKEEQQCGLTDRAGNVWKVFDIDGTREAARQRALPQAPQLPLPQRRLDKVCAPGYTGRKRGEIVRTRTTVLQAHSYQWLGTFGNPGNGVYREELRRAVEAIRSYLRAHQFPEEHALLRLDGLYGTGAVLADLLGFAFVMRGKDYRLLDLPVVQTRLHLPADQQFSRPESGLVRTLYDCPDVLVGPSGQRCRLVVATHPAGPTKKRIGVERDGLIYELFLTKLPQQAFTVADVVALYLHRGAFETTLSDEDLEQDPDRWCSHAACGQEAWQIVSQWVWNLRLELGHQLEPEPIRTTEFAPALPPVHKEATDVPFSSQGYGPAAVALPWKAGRFSGQDFVLQPDGTLHCPAGQSLIAHERRREGDGSLRVVYAASIRSCRPCPLRQQCQWQGNATAKPRQVSVLLRPLMVGSAPLLWHDWSRRHHRRACKQRLAFPAGGGAGRTGSLCWPEACTCAPVSCTTCAFSSRLSRAVRSQRASLNRRSGDDQTLRGPRKLCHFSGFGDGVTPSRQPLASLFSDRLASSSGSSWLFFLAVPQFLPFSVLFALHPAVSAFSHRINIPFCTIFTHQIRRSSSAISLRNSWDWQS